MRTDNSGRIGHLYNALGADDQFGHIGVEAEHHDVIAVMVGEFGLLRGALYRDRPTY